MNPHKITSFILLSLTGLLGGNLENEIKIKIPDFENGYVVESYVSPGTDFGLLITKSYGFFEVFDSDHLDPDQLTHTMVQGVQGYIDVNSVRHLLLNQIKRVRGATTVYNYLLKDEVQFKEKDRIDLSFTFPTGE